MAIVAKDLTALNSVLVIDEIDEENGTVTLQYGAGGAGTVALEGTLGATASGGAAEWVNLRITNVATKVDSDNATAPGIYYAEMIGYRSVRAKKTVGAASCPVILSVNDE